MKWVIFQRQIVVKKKKKIELDLPNYDLSDFVKKIDLMKSETCRGEKDTKCSYYFLHKTNKRSIGRS